MNNKIIDVIAGLVFAFAVLVPVTHADTWDQATLFKFYQPVQVPGQSLPAGSYWFVLTDNRPQIATVVKVYASDRSRVITEFETRTTELPGGDWGGIRFSGNTVVTLAKQTEPDQHAVMLKWFYPGQADGHEFIYSAKEQEEFQNAPKEVLTVDSHGSMFETNLIQAAVTAGE